MPLIHALFRAPAAPAEDVAPEAAPEEAAAPAEEAAAPAEEVQVSPCAFESSL